MILIIDLNSVLEKTYYIEKLLPRVETEVNTAIYKSGGPGNNSSQILNKLNINLFSIGFMGGINGRYMVNDLREQGINCDYIQIRDEMKTSLSVIEKDNFLFKVSESKPRITREELGSFYELYKNSITNSSVVCGLGDLPNGVPQEIYYDLINISNSNNKKFLLDVKGSELKYAIQAKPYMIKLNVDELENLTSLKLNFENEIIKAGYYMLDKDIQIVVIDLDDKGSIVLYKDMGYRIELNNMDIGNLKEDQGYMVAGYAFGMDKGYEIEVIMKLGQSFRTAYGIAENMEDIDMSDIKKIMGNISIMPIYY